MNKKRTSNLFYLYYTLTWQYVTTVSFDSKVNSLSNSSWFYYYSFHKQKPDKFVCERRIKYVKAVTTQLTFRLDRTRVSHVGNLLLATLPPLYYLPKLF